MTMQTRYILKNDFLLHTQKELLPLTSSTGRWSHVQNLRWGNIHIGESDKENPKSFYDKDDVTKALKINIDVKPLYKWIYLFKNGNSDTIPIFGDDENLYIRMKGDYISNISTLDCTSDLLSSEDNTYSKISVEQFLLEYEKQKRINHEIYSIRREPFKINFSMIGKVTMQEYADSLTHLNHTLPYDNWFESVNFHTFKIGYINKFKKEDFDFEEIELEIK